MKPRSLTALTALSLTATALAACGSGSSSTGQAKTATPATAATSTTASSSASSYKKYTDVSYAKTVGRAHLMDVYVPTTGTGPYPVIMYIAGSAFQSDDTKSGAPTGAASGGGLPAGGKLPSGGSLPKLPAGAKIPDGMKLPAGVTGASGATGASSAAPTGLGGTTTAQSLAEKWASKGYVVVGFNVRSATQAKFPAQLYDTKAAIRFLRANADKYSIDSAHVGIMGTSSGSWSAIMAGVTSDEKGMEGNLGNADQSSAVQSVIDLFGPTDFLTMDSEKIKGGQAHNPASSPESMLIGCALQTCKAKAKAASPITYVSKDDPPFYIANGTKDLLVPPKQSRELFNALSKQGVDAQYTLVPGVGHSDSYLASANDSKGRTVWTSTGGTVTKGTEPAPTYATLLAFLNKTLKTN